jgi:hypothetical protein
LPAAPRSLDLVGEGITAVVWATGYRPDNPWLHVPGVLDPRGRIRHARGVTPVSGLYVIGARWQHRATSHQIGGVGADARHLAAHIAARPSRAPEVAVRRDGVGASSSSWARTSADHAGGLAERDRPPLSGLTPWRDRGGGTRPCRPR